MQKNKLSFEDIGLIDYDKAWEYQESFFNENIRLKGLNRDLPVEEQAKIENRLLFCEHPHVYTLGKSGSEDNLLLNYIQLQANDAKFVKTNRGGDITYHGPGQIVGYPIIDLEQFDIGVKEYIHLIEEAIILFLKQFNIEGDRLDGATGVWLDVGKPGLTRKICAIGVRASRHITMHGFALNINTDLKYFDFINPCGFVDKGVTSIKKELDKDIDFTKAKLSLRSCISSVFEK